jgi:hypothetical protein
MSKKVSPMDNHPQFEEKPGSLPSLHYAEIDLLNFPIFGPQSSPMS